MRFESSSSRINDAHNDGETRNSGTAAAGTDLFAGESVDPRLAYAVQWAPHGGGAAADIADRFGVSAPQLYRQVLDLLSADGGSRLPAAVRDHVTAAARRRIWLGA